MLQKTVIFFVMHVDWLGKQTRFKMAARLIFTVTLTVMRVTLTTFPIQNIHLHLSLPLCHTCEVTLLSHQWLQFRVINEVELRDEVVVVLVAGIDVGLCTHAADAVKVMNVNMHKHPEETAQDLLAHLLEVPGERYT